MDLRTSYMGLDLKHPIVASASPLSASVDGMKRVEDGGASALVMFSLFEEQIRRENEAFEYLTEVGTQSFPEALTYFPEVDDYHVGPELYLDLIRRGREALDIPIIASLNGVTNSGWTDYARLMYEAGASGIELNIFYIPADMAQTGREVEDLYLDILKSVKAAVPIPVALKLSPFFSAFGNMAKRLDDAGADGLVLFNRFYQPDFDLEALEVSPTLQLSTSSEIRLPLLWIAVLHGRIKASLGATRGVHEPEDAIKYLMAGADAVFTTSALLRNGTEFTQKLVDGMREWMERREYASVSQMKGSMSQQHVADPTAFERSNYIRILESYKSPYMA